MQHSFRAAAVVIFLVCAASAKDCCICDVSGDWNRLLGDKRNGFAVREQVFLESKSEEETVDIHVQELYKVLNVARRLRGSAVVEQEQQGSPERKPKDAPFESERVLLSRTFEGRSELYPKIQVESFRNRSVLLKMETRSGFTRTAHGKFSRGCEHIEWAGRSEAWCQRPHCQPKRLNTVPSSPLVSTEEQKVCDIAGEWTGLVGGKNRVTLPSLSIAVRQKEDMFFANADGLWRGAKGVLSADGLISISVPVGGQEHRFEGLIDNDCKHIRWVGVGKDEDSSKAITWCRRPFCALAVNNHLPRPRPSAPTAAAAATAQE